MYINTASFASGLLQINIKAFSELFQFLIDSKLQSLCIVNDSASSHYPNNYTYSQALVDIMSYVEEKKSFSSMKNTLTEYECIIQESRDPFMEVLNKWIVANCNNLEVLNVAGCRETVFDRIFRNKSSLNWDNLKKLTLDVPSYHIGDILRNITDSKARLESLDILLWTKKFIEKYRKKGYDILNTLKMVLESQLVQHNHLKALLFRGNSLLNERSFGYNRLNENEWLRMLYLVIIHLFRDKQVKYRKELSIKFEMEYHAEVHHLSKLSCYFEEVEQMMDLLKKNVLAPSIHFAFAILNEYLSDSDQNDFTTFHYNLQSKHGWNIEQIQSNDMYRCGEWKAVDHKAFVNKYGAQYLDDSNEEQRYKQNIDEKPVIDSEGFEHYPKKVLLQMSKPVINGKRTEFTFDNDRDVVLERAIIHDFSFPKYSGNAPSWNMDKILNRNNKSQIRTQRNMVRTQRNNNNNRAQTGFSFSFDSGFNWNSNDDVTTHSDWNF